MIRRNVTRETLSEVFDRGQRRRVMVTIRPNAGSVEFRLKGTRRLYGLPCEYLYVHACQKRVALDKAQKARERKANGGHG